MFDLLCLRCALHLAAELGNSDQGPLRLTKVHSRPACCSHSACAPTDAKKVIIVLLSFLSLGRAVCKYLHTNGSGILDEAHPQLASATAVTDTQQEASAKAE